MKFDYTEEQQLLADSVRRFVSQDYGFDARRKIVRRERHLVAILDPKRITRIRIRIVDFDLQAQVLRGAWDTDIHGLDAALVIRHQRDRQRFGVGRHVGVASQANDGDHDSARRCDGCGCPPAATACSPAAR